MAPQFRIFKFKIDLSSSLRNKEGMAIYAKMPSGQKAWAEVSPLNGWSKESLLDAEKQLFQLKEEFLSRCNSFEEGIDFLQHKSLYPSVAFGLESLLYSLFTPQSCIARSFPVCALLTGNYEQVCKQISFVLQEQYKHAKLKIAGLTFHEAHSAIAQLRGKVHLRIDVNRKWSLTESLSFFSHYPLDAFDYIEEPVQNPQDLSLFPFPIALDESLREGYIPPRKIQAFIIKPMMTGSFAEIQQLTRLAHQRQSQVVFSSSYESGVGLYHLCALFDRLSLPISPLGVDPYRLIKKDILKQPHWISKGVLKLFSLDVKTHLLHEIAYV